MSERSLLWQSGVGDGGPYTDEEMRLYAEILGLADGDNVSVVPNQLNELIVTSPANNDIRVASGRAIPDGTPYENTAEITFNTASPAVGTTGRRVVLQKDWTARTIRAAIITSADGTAALPALTQTDGTTWEIPLASFTITTGGVIAALTDEREWTEVPRPGGRFIARAGLTRYTMPGWGIGDVATGAITTNPDRIIFQLIQIHKAMTFTDFAFRLTANAGAGEVLRAGLYTATDAADGFTPGALIVDAGSATIDAGAVATKEISISGGLTLQPGYYFLAHVHDGTGAGSTSAVDRTSAISAPITSPTAALGSAVFESVLMTATNAGANWPGTGLPDPAPAVTAISGDDELRVWMKDAT